MTYQTKLLKKGEVAEGTMAFWFEKPPGYEFEAGQHIDLFLPQIEESHAFSLSSAPYEKDLMIATRMRDTTFKNALKELKAGAEVEITHSHGDLILHSDSEKPAVFLAGGIGIKPVRSIILQAIRSDLKGPQGRTLAPSLFLFYSNRRPELATFLDELTNLADKSENFTLVPTMTAAENWIGKTGYITKEMIEEFISDFSNAVFYIAGPPDFVAAMRRVIAK